MIKELKKRNQSNGRTRQNSKDLNIEDLIESMFIKNFKKLTLFRRIKVESESLFVFLFFLNSYHILKEGQDRIEQLILNYNNNYSNFYKFIFINSAFLFFIQLLFKVAII